LIRFAIFQMHDPMPEQLHKSALKATANLLTYYSFDSGNRSPDKVLDKWLTRYPLSWVRLALIESLYQGRYKAISVEQILALWQRKGEPSYHFSSDFENLVSENLPKVCFSQVPEAPKEPIGRKIGNQPIAATSVTASQRGTTGSVRPAARTPSRIPTPPKAVPPLQTTPARGVTVVNLGNTTWGIRGQESAIAKEPSKPLAPKPSSFSANLNSSNVSAQGEGGRAGLVEPALATEPRVTPQLLSSIQTQKILVVEQPEPPKAESYAGAVPILQFVPSPEKSTDFHSKLAAIAQTAVV
jgi:hypothetical protein